MAYSKFADVDAVLQHASTSLKTIESQYNEALKTKQVPAALQIEIKNFLQNLRSALDYVSQRVPGHGRNYPMCAHPNELSNATRGASPAAASILSKWQPFSHTWLKNFNWLNNEHKHQMLVPQTTTQVETTQAHSAGGSVTWDPGSVRFGPGVFIEGRPVDVTTQMPAGAIIRKTIWIDFHFDPTGAPAGISTNISVLPFLRECAAKVPLIVEELETTIP